MILVTAPTSTIGSELVERMIDRGAPLRLLARDSSRIPASLRERVDVVEGSHGDAEAIEWACEGVEAVFWLSPNLPDVETVDQSFAGFARPAVEAFARQGIERVVGISALGRGSALADQAGMVTATLALDDLIASSGVAYRAVTCPSLMHNLLNHVGSITEQGTLFMTIDPDLKAPTVASRDVAAVSADLLLDDTWRGSDEVPVLGPEDLSPRDWARIMSEVLGFPVRYQQVPGSALKERLLGFGYTDGTAQAMVDMFDAKNEGLDEAASIDRSATPTTFRDWCEDVLKPAISAAPDEG